MAMQVHRKRKEGCPWRASLLYDVENRLVIRTCLDRYDDSERELAKENTLKWLCFPQPHIRNLMVLDRGYPSADLLLYLKEKNISYVMRVSKTFFTEVIHTTTSDEIMSIEITPTRSRKHKQRGQGFQWEPFYTYE